MRAVVISHAAVIPANQVPYCIIERMPDTALVMIVPERWNASIGGMTEFTRHEDLRCQVITKPVRFNGNINVHSYRGLSEMDFPFTPEVIYADEDPFSLAAHQAFRIAKRLKVPFVFKSNQNLVKKYPPPFCWTERAVYNGATCAQAIAPACADVLRQKGYEGHIEIIPHAVDTGIWQPKPAGKLREALGIAPDAFVIGYLGRLTPEKGLRDLLRAVNNLEARLAADGSTPRDTVLLMVGEGELRGEIEAWSESQTRARALVTGVVPHGEAVAQHVNCMDVMVLPSRTTASWKEQFGRVVIEGMACGVPVIGSDSGHIPVLIEETGGGLVFPEGDVGAFAEALHKLRTDPDAIESLGETGRAHVNEHYSYERIAQQTADMLRDAIERYPSAG